MGNDGCWTIPCNMADGSLRLVDVQKGINPPEIEKKLAALHRQAVKIVHEKTKLDKRLQRAVKRAFDT